MDNEIRSYSWLIYSLPKGGDAEPDSAVHMEIGDGFERFLAEALSWLDAFHDYAYDDAFVDAGYVRDEDADEDEYCRFQIRTEIQGGAPTHRSVSCNEQEILLSLLYSCLRNPGVRIRELNYQGTVYTDISCVEACKARNHLYPVQLRAKKDGHDVTVCFFGPYVDGVEGDDPPSFYGPLYSSAGVIELENQMYIGVFPFRGDTTTSVNEVVHTFLERNGNDLTFHVLLEGTLHPKISKNDRRVVFHYTPLNFQVFTLLDAPNQNLKDMDVVFENNGNGYQSAAGGGSPVITFLPPQAPDAGSMDMDSAHALCAAYLDALRAAFSEPKS